MKTNKLFLALTALALLACNKKEPEVIVPQTADYKGTVTVMYKGEPYDNENIEVNFTPSEDGKTASITIFKIRFVPQMPVTIDVTIPNVQLTSTSTEVLLSCDEVIPLAMGGEYPRYKVTNLTGSIEHGTLDFSLNFGDIPTTFTGRQLLK
jgi:hypothetical protein